jgi:hypothetical protein
MCNAHAARRSRVHAPALTLCPSPASHAALARPPAPQALVAALRAKALALADLHALGADASVLEQLDSTMSALHRWAAPADHAKLAAAWHGAHGRHALALQALDEALAKEKGLLPKAEQEARLPLLRALGWAFLAESASVQLLRSFPKAYPPGF